MKERDLFFDNLKYILIFLVVLGHFGEAYMGHGIIRGITIVIYSFHMPLFIFVSGYFSKNITSAKIQDLNVLLLYLTFQVYHFLYTRATGLGLAYSLSFLYPVHANWYLLALFVWRLAAPYFRFFKKGSALIVVLILVLLTGFSREFNETPLYRIFFFLPFFLLGFYCNDLKALMNKYRNYRLLFVIVFFLGEASLFVIAQYKQPGYALWNAFVPYYGYIGFGNLTYGFIARTAGICCSLILAWCFLFMVPGHRTFYSDAGKNTLYVYVFHMFIVWAVALLPYRYLLTELLCIVSSFCIAYILSSTVAVNMLKRLIINIPGKPARSKSEQQDAMVTEDES